LIGPDHVFLDVDSIPIGTDFRQHIHAAIGRCDIVLVLIGPSWLGSWDERLMDPKDHVRLEVEEALARDIPTVPVLLGQTNLPTETALPEAIRPLIRRQAERIDPGVDFDSHVDRLCDKLLGFSLVTRRVGRRQRRLAVGIGSAVLLLLVIGVVFGVFWERPKPEPAKEPVVTTNQTVSGNSGPTNVAGRDVVVNTTDPNVAKDLEKLRLADEKAREEQRQREIAKAKFDEDERIRLLKEKAVQDKKDEEIRLRLEREKKAAEEKAYRDAIKEEVASINAVAGINRRDPDQLTEFAKFAADMRQYAAAGRFFAAQSILWIEAKQLDKAKTAYDKSFEYYKTANDDNILRWLNEELNPRIKK